MAIPLLEDGGERECTHLVDKGKLVAATRRVPLTGAHIEGVDLESQSQ